MAPSVPPGHDEAYGPCLLLRQMAAKHQAERLRGIAPREIVHAAISLGFAEYSDNARWIKISSGNGIIDAAYIVRSGR